MKNEIKFQDENHLSSNKKDWTDLQWLNEFYKFLQGELPEGMRLQKGHKPNMSEKKAFTIVWYLQEHIRILPDNIERCDICGDLYDSNSEGIHWETKGKFYCGCCSDLVPENYDRGRR